MAADAAEAADAVAVDASMSLSFGGTEDKCFSMNLQD